jgi:hypothetical protein
VDLEEETIKLGLGERVGPFLLDWVPGGEDLERIGEAVGRRPDRDAPLLHRLQQGGLGLGRGPVDLVGEDEVVEDRPGEKAHSAARPPLPVVLFLEHVGSGDVGGEKVGRELDATEVERERFGERRDEERLGEPWHPDEEGMTAREERDEHGVDDRFLPDHARADRRMELLVRGGRFLQELDVIRRRRGRRGGRGRVQRGSRIGLVHARLQRIARGTGPVKRASKS